MREMTDATEPIRVLLVDDQALLRESFRRLLELEGEGIEVVGAAGDGQEALALVERVAQSGRAPHRALLGLRMPRMDGRHATALLRATLPHGRVPIQTTFHVEQPALAR